MPGLFFLELKDSVAETAFVCNVAAFIIRINTGGLLIITMA